MNVGVESTLALSAQCCGSRAKYTESSVWQVLRCETQSHR